MSHNQCKVWGHEVQCRTFSAYIIHKVQCNKACCKIHCTMYSVFSALQSRKEWWCCFSFSLPLTIRWHMLILHLAVPCLYLSYLGRECHEDLKIFFISFSMRIFICIIFVVHICWSITLLCHVSEKEKGTIVLIFLFFPFDLVVACLCINLYLTSPRIANKGFGKYLDISRYI